MSNVVSFSGVANPVQKRQQEPPPENPGYSVDLKDLFKDQEHWNLDKLLAKSGVFDFGTFYYTDPEQNETSVMRVVLEVLAPGRLFATQIEQLDPSKEIFVPIMNAFFERDPDTKDSQITDILVRQNITDKKMLGTNLREEPHNETMRSMVVNTLHAFAQKIEYLKGKERLPEAFTKTLHDRMLKTPGIEGCAANGPR